MVFNSITYFVFLSVFVPLYYLVNNKSRIFILHFSSFVFLMNYNPEQMILIVILILMNFYGAKIINGSIRLKKIFFIIFLALNIIALLNFKYMDFIIHNLNFVFNGHFVFNKMSFNNSLLPIGLSFITFKNISYLIEVYRGNYKCEDKISNYTLYITFFPTILAGPIDRPNLLIPNLKNLPDGISLINLESGLYYVILGLFQKTVIADRLAYFVNAGFANYNNIYGFGVMLLVFLYSIQIYCDFAGYSNIALGSARMFGIKIMQNFNLPYFSKSLSDFWRRWHISLSSWLRDYMFLPIAYLITRKLTNKKYLSKKVENYSYIIGTIITMLIAGAWHGADWNFVTWGGLIGIFMAFGFYTRKFRKKLWRKTGLSLNSGIKEFIQIAITFSLISFCWIFFRAENLTQAFTILANLFSDIFKFDLMISYNELVFSIVIILFYILFEFLRYKGIVSGQKVLSQKIILRVLVSLLLLSFTLFTGYFSSSQFIYFKF